MSFAGKAGLLGLILFFGLSGAPAFAKPPHLHITWPSNGALLEEGQTYTVTVAADPAIKNISIDAEYPVPFMQPTSNGNQFTVILPMKIPPGAYHFTAVGSGAGGEVVYSDLVTVDIERHDDPVQLLAEPLSLNFRAVGAHSSIIVYGTYADGTRLIISNSTKTRYLSDNPRIATVSANGSGFGVVTAVSVGQCSVVVQVGPSLAFPVVVIVAPSATQ